MELLIFFLAAATPPGEARQCTNRVHSMLPAWSCSAPPGTAGGIEGFHCTGQVSFPSPSLQVLGTQTEELGQLTGSKSNVWLVLGAKAAAALEIQPRISQPGSGKGEQVQRCTPKMKPCTSSSCFAARPWCLLLSNTSDLTRSAGRFL